MFASELIKIQDRPLGVSFVEQKSFGGEVVYNLPIYRYQSILTLAFVHSPENLSFGIPSFVSVFEEIVSQTSLKFLKVSKGFYYQK